MFLVLSKLLDVLVAPITWSALLVLAGVVVAGRRPRLSRGLSGAGVCVLLAFSLEPVSRRLYGFAERDAPSTFHPDPPYDAVIVLGGATEVRTSRVSGQVELNAAGERLVRAAELLRRGDARMALLSAGRIRPVPGDPSEAAQAREVLVALGIAPERLVLEEASRNTRENAVETARLVRARGWRRVLLLTSAYHVPRALGCFRAVGLAPDVLPVDHRAGDGRVRFWLPRSGPLHDSTEAIRELVGRVVYRLAGYQ